MRPLILLIALVVCSAQAHAQISNITTVAWEKLPDVVRRAIEVNTGGEAVEMAERGVENGRVIYSVTLPNGENQTRVLIRENGILVPPGNNPGPQPVVAEVPEPVVVTNPLPEGVTRTNIGGTTVYNVVSEGALQTSEVQVMPDGRVISTVQAGPQGLIEMQKVSRAAVPPEVERAIQTQTGPGEIIDISRGTYNGQNVYDVVYQQLDERIKVSIANNGQVLQQTIISTEDNRVLDVEPYIGATFLPIVVQTTLSAAAGDNPIESVRQEVLGGQVTYVATYSDNGQPVTVRISQTGQLLR